MSDEKIAGAPIEPIESLATRMHFAVEDILVEMMREINTQISLVRKREDDKTEPWMQARVTYGVVVDQVEKAYKVLSMHPTGGVDARQRRAVKLVILFYKHLMDLRNRGLLKEFNHNQGLWLEFVETLTEFMSRMDKIMRGLP